MDKLPINPFYLGNAFMNYCIKEGYMTLEISEDKKLHYYATEAGVAALRDRFGIVFGSECSLEQTDE